jgi:hypothetical protein
MLCCEEKFVTVGIEELKLRPLISWTSLNRTYSGLNPGPVWVQTGIANRTPATLDPPVWVSRLLKPSENCTEGDQIGTKQSGPFEAVPSALLIWTIYYRILKHVEARRRVCNYKARGPRLRSSTHRVDFLC